jgi:hypothetical protein
MVVVSSRLPTVLNYRQFGPLTRQLSMPIKQAVNHKHSTEIKS